MLWLYPGFLIGTAAVALPILLHLFRRRPKRTVLFPTLRFLAAAAPQNDRSKRLRRWLVLFLRCAVLSLFAAAFARPFLATSKGGQRQAFAVVIDNSFSLRAGRRWTDLRTWVRDQIRDAKSEDTIGLLVMAPKPTWIAPLSTRRDSALAILDTLAPGWDTAQAEPALRLAGDALAATAADRRSIVYFGDHQRVSWAGCDFGKPLPPGVRTVFPDVPAPLARQAAVRAPVITRTPTGFHVAVAIENFTAAENRTLYVYRDGATAPVWRQDISLPEREIQTCQIDLPPGPEGVSAYFTVSLDEDDLPADDRAYGVWQASGEHPVLLDPTPDSGSDYVGAALAATAGLKPYVQVLPIPASAWPPSAVAVLRNDASFSGAAAERLTAFLRGGGSALIFVGGGSAELRWLETAGLKMRPLEEEGDGLELRDWAVDHPLVAGLASHSASTLLDWRFRRGWALPTDAVEPLALWPETGAAIGETTGIGGRVLICGFGSDRRDSDWPAREMFVPFVHRAVTYLLGSPTGGTATPAQVGQPLPLPAETGFWRALAGPTAAAPPVQAGGTIAPNAPGVYEFSYGGQKKLFAVNLPPGESDPAPWSDGKPWRNLESTAHMASASLPRVPVSAIQAEQHSPLWWWCLASAAVFLAAELAIANRTTR
jgi:hypothetical protein